MCIQLILTMTTCRIKQWSDKTINTKHNITLNDGSPDQHIMWTQLFLTMSTCRMKQWSIKTIKHNKVTDHLINIMCIQLILTMTTYRIKQWSDKTINTKHNITLNDGSPDQHIMWIQFILTMSTCRMKQWSVKTIKHNKMTDHLINISCASNWSSPWQPVEWNNEVIKQYMAGGTTQAGQAMAWLILWPYIQVNECFEHKHY